jgi:hypothetical protein
LETAGTGAEATAEVATADEILGNATNAGKLGNAKVGAGAADAAEIAEEFACVLCVNAHAVC